MEEYEKLTREIECSFASNWIKEIAGIMSIRTVDGQPGKTIIKWSDILSEFSFLWNRPTITKEQVDLLEKFLEIYNKEDSKEVWVGKIKSLGVGLKTIRLALTGMEHGPDLYQLCKIMFTECWFCCVAYR